MSVIHLHEHAARKHLVAALARLDGDVLGDEGERVEGCATVLALETMGETLASAYLTGMAELIRHVRSDMAAALKAMEH